MVVDGKEVDCKLKDGDVQQSHFTHKDPPPFYPLPKTVRDAFKKAAKDGVVGAEEHYYAPEDDTEVPGMTMKVKGRVETKVIEGYVREEKGLKQYVWERGWYVDGMTTDQMRDALGACPDFKNESSKLEKLFREAGHILEMSPKGHPELAGVGVEYSWGKSKMYFRREKTTHRIGGNFEKLVRESLGPAVLPIARVRKFARKARAMRELYKSHLNSDDTTNYNLVQKMYKTMKTHRSALDTFHGFIKNT